MFHVQAMIKFCLACRRYAMVDTRVVCTGQWWTGTRRGDRWFSLCAQKRTKWWDPHKIWSAEKGQGSTLISHGPTCWSIHKPTTGLTLLPSKASSSGFPLPNHDPNSSSFCLINYSHPPLLRTVNGWIYRLHTSS